MISVISKKLMHKVVNLLQIIMGQIDMAEQEQDEKKRAAHFDRARLEIRRLTELLLQKVRMGPL